VINPQFDAAYAFDGKLALVILGSTEPKLGYIDKEGRYVWGPTR
jgi:hypothetical protein